MGLGSPPWRARKLAELRELFALEVIADRMHIVAVDAAGVRSEPSAPLTVSTLP